ncbi:hypothetical protein Tco_0327585 [Tanacetum coccineum]
MNDVPVIVLLSKNGYLVNNNEVHVVSSSDEKLLPLSTKKEEETDEDFTIRIKRSKNSNLPSIPKKSKMVLIDESSDDDVGNHTYVKHHLDKFFDDSHEHLHKGEELVDGSTDEVPHSDEEDDRSNEYDLTDSFIDDGPLVEEHAKDDSDIDN